MTTGRRNRSCFFTLLLFLVVALQLLSCSGLITSSAPKRDGDIRGNVSDVVDIYRDTWGVPHIFAGTTEDLLFGQGFAHGQERLFQMDTERRLASGSLSEVLGEKTLQIDSFFRTLGLRRMADEIYVNMEGESQRLIDRYAEGVNRAVDTQATLPIEFRLLRYAPAPFTGRDVIITGLLKSFGLSQWMEELAYHTVIQRAGIKYFQEINPFGKDLSRIHILSSRGGSSIRSLARFVEHASKLPLFPRCGGSNSWVISSEKSADGVPYLANDPHLLLSSPSLFFENHLLSPELDVYGYSFPGAPFVIIGFNRDVAWGFTNVMLDDVDLFIEKDIRKGEAYSYKGLEVEYARREESISIRGKGSRTLRVRTSVHGPIISPVFPGIKEEFSFRWTGQDAKGKHIKSLHLLNRARNEDDIREALSYFEFSAQNVVYATRDGTIGYQLAGMIPRRKLDHPPVPVPGEGGAYDWEGYLPFGSNPSSLNPREGFLVTANFPPRGGGDTIYISSIYEPPARGKRITEVLSKKGTLSKHDLQELQMDRVSHPARSLVPLLLAAAESGREGDETFEKALALISEWDFLVSAKSRGAAIFEVFYEMLMRKVFLDELGPDGLEVFLATRRVPTAALDYLLFRNPGSKWFDDTLTPERENRDLTIAGAFEAAVTHLRELLGNNPETWEWGRLHRAEMKHPFGEKWYLERFFNIRSNPLGGDGRTVFKTEFPHGLDFSAVVGPAMRMVVSPLMPEEASVVLSTGQSGHFFEPHYRDQVHLWEKGEYRRAVFSREEASNTHTNHLRIVPDKPRSESREKNF